MDLVEPLAIALLVTEAELVLVAITANIVDRGLVVHLVGVRIEPIDEQAERSIDLHAGGIERLRVRSAHAITHDEVREQADPECSREGGGDEAGVAPCARSIAPEIVEQVIHRRIAIARHLRQPAQQDRAHRARDTRTRWRGRDATFADVVAELVERLALERPHAVQRLVERDAVVELIGPRIDVAAGELLRRHVCRGAEHDAGVGELELLGRLVAAFVRARRRETEIGDAHATVGADQTVVGLEVAVDDASGVRGREPATRGDVRLDDLRDRPLLLLPGAEAAALDQLHRDERRAVGDPGVVDLHDVRVIDLRHRLGFLHQALRERVVGLVQELERDLSS